MKFTNWSVQARTVYSPQLRFGPYTILAWTAHFVNLHIALKAMFYLLNECWNTHSIPSDERAIWATLCMFGWRYLASLTRRLTVQRPY